MKLTPEQQSELDRARKEGRYRVHLSLTDEQRDYVERAREQEEACRDETIADFHRLRAAESEPGFSGDLRRAITASRIRPDVIANELQIDIDLLEDFRRGDATLPSDVADRLIRRLGLRLMAEIATDSMSRRSQ